MAKVKKSNLEIALAQLARANVDNAISVIECLIEDTFYKMEYCQAKLAQAQEDRASQLILGIYEDQIKIANSRLRELREAHQAALFVARIAHNGIADAGDTFYLLATDIFQIPDKKLLE